MSIFKNMKSHYHNDKKEKQYSHEIYIKDNGLFELSILDIVGYGSSKEEALEEFKREAKRLFDSYKELEKLILETDFINENMIEVDCFGNEIVNNDKV